MVHLDKCSTCGCENEYSEHSKDLRVDETVAHKASIKLNEITMKLYGKFEPLPSDMGPGEKEEPRKSLKSQRTADADKLNLNQPDLTVWKCPKCGLLNQFENGSTCAHSADKLCDFDI